MFSVTLCLDCAHCVRTTIIVSGKRILIAVWISYLTGYHCQRMRLWCERSEHTYAVSTHTAEIINQKPLNCSKYQGIPELMHEEIRIAIPFRTCAY